MLLEALWFFLPAGLANGAPVIANRIPWLNRWNTPIDFGLVWRGERVFGKNKTWRGLLAGMAIATLMVAIQKYLFSNNLWFLELSWLDYRSNEVWLLGPLMGAGALLGDSIESFFKRQRGVKPGQAWFPFDQIDYIIGGLVFASPIVNLNAGQVLTVLGLYFGLHLCAAYLFYHLGMKDSPI